MAGVVQWQIGKVIASLAVELVVFGHGERGIHVDGIPGLTDDKVICNADVGVSSVN